MTFMLIENGASAYEVFHRNEPPAGALNGTNTVFALSSVPVEGTLCLYLGGLFQTPGVGSDYTITGKTITMATAPPSGAAFRAIYYA